MFSIIGKSAFDSKIILAVISLNVKSEFDDVAVLNDVIFAFEAQSAGFSHALHAAVFVKIFKGNRFGSDKSTFEVRVDDAGYLRRLHALLESPGARFLAAGSEARCQAQQHRVRQFLLPFERKRPKLASLLIRQSF